MVGIQGRIDKPDPVNIDQKFAINAASDIFVSTPDELCRCCGSSKKRVHVIRDHVEGILRKESELWNEVYLFCNDDVHFFDNNMLPV